MNRWLLICMSLLATVVTAKELGTDATALEKSRTDPAPGFQVYIHHESHGDQTFLCYGVRLRQHSFLTTASCFDRFRESGKLHIREGSTFVSPAYQPYPIGPRRAVTGVLIHPEYRNLTGNPPPASRKYNLAIVKVLEAITEEGEIAELPKETPKYPTACILTVLKSQPTDDNAFYESIVAKVIPIPDCALANNVGVEGLNSSFCVQVTEQFTAPQHLFSGAPIKCNGRVPGLFSWGSFATSSHSHISNLVLADFADQLEWIQMHVGDSFGLPGADAPQPPSTSSNPGGGDTWPASSTKRPPIDDDDDGAMQSLPFSLPLLLLISAFVGVFA